MTRLRAFFKRLIDGYFEGIYAKESSDDNNN